MNALILQSFSSNDWFSLIAIVISLVALFVSGYEVLSNKPKLRISASFGLVFDTAEVSQTVNIYITNIGRQPTTIKSVSVGKRKAKKAYWIKDYKSFSNLPKKIAPGEEVTLAFSSDGNVDFEGQEISMFDLIKKKKYKLYITQSWRKKAHVIKVR